MDKNNRIIEKNNEILNKIYELNADYFSCINDRWNYLNNLIIGKKDIISDDIYEYFLENIDQCNKIYLDCKIDFKNIIQEFQILNKTLLMSNIYLYSSLNIIYFQINRNEDINIENYLDYAYFRCSETTINFLREYNIIKENILSFSDDHFINIYADTYKSIVYRKACIENLDENSYVKIKNILMYLNILERLEHLRKCCFDLKSLILDINYNFIYQNIFIS